MKINVVLNHQLVYTLLLQFQVKSPLFKARKSFWVYGTQFPEDLGHLLANRDENLLDIKKHDGWKISTIDERSLKRKIEVVKIITDKDPAPCTSRKNICVTKSKNIGPQVECKTVNKTINIEMSQIVPALFSKA